MDEQIKAALEEQAKAWADFRKANDERLSKLEAGDTKGIAAIELKLERINAAIDEAAKKVKEANDRVSALEGEHNRPSGLLGTRATGEDPAFRAYMAAGDTTGFRATANTQSNPDGGYLVPDNVSNVVDRIATATVAMRQLAAIQSISVGNSYIEHITTSGASGAWVGENAARPATSTPNLARIETVAHEMYAQPMASQTLLDDSAVNIEQWLGDEVGIAFGELEGAAFIVGDGVEKPRGILSYDTVADASYAWGKLGYVKSGAATTFTATNPEDRIVDLTQALKAKYRNGAAFLMSTATLGAVRKFKTTLGYLWQPSFQAGQPSLLLGYPVHEDDYMQELGTGGNLAMAFGNFKAGYRIVDRIGIRVLRDPFSNKPFVGFYTTKRVGGGVRNFEAIKLLKLEA